MTRFGQTAAAARSTQPRYLFPPAGSWYNVTPPGMNLSPDSPSAGPGNNFGAQQVVADPANPGTFYVSFTYEGIWKSIDFGATWVKISSGSDVVDNSRPAMEIAPDGSYILAACLYPNNPFSNGCWKSVAPVSGGDPPLGTSWRLIIVPGVPNNDMAMYRIDPADKTHVIAAPHTGTSFFYESNDSGETWTSYATAAGAGVAPDRVHIIDSTTILATYDVGSGINPYRGVKSAGPTWTWTECITVDESGASVAGQTSFHSDQQIFVDRVNKVGGNNVVYVGGPLGIHRSVDNGLNFVSMSTPQGGQGLIATPTKIYSTASFAINSGTFGPAFMIAPRVPGTPGATWIAPATPGALVNGWLYAGAAQLGNHYVIVAGCWNAGLWRYIE